MVLLAPLALALLVLPQAARAEPITVALLGTAFLIANPIAAGLITFAITFAITSAVSYVAQALFKPSSSGSGSSQRGGTSPAIDNKATIRQGTAPRRIIYGRARVGGVIAFIEKSTSDGMLNMVIVFAGHEIAAFEEIWINDEISPVGVDGFVNGGRYAGKVAVNQHTGSDTQTANTNIIDKFPAQWSINHRLRGVAYLYVTILKDQELFPDIPNITAVIRGKNNIYDPRTGGTGYTPNSALCLANYLCDQRYGIPVDFATEIDTTALIAAANACDEAIELAGGGYEPRYSCDGSVECSAQPQEIIGRLLGSMHGRAIYNGDKWKIIAGVYQTPTVSLNDDDLRGGMKVQTIASRRDIFNAVKGTYIAPGQRWQETDFPIVRSNTFKALDGGVDLYKDMTLPFCASHARAQRIAKIDLLAARQPLTVFAPCKLTARRVQAGDTITWTSELFGWTNKPFEVRKTRFAVSEGADGPTLGVDLELSETSPSVYSWLTSEESMIDDAPNTDLPTAPSVLPPTNLAVVEEVYETLLSAGVKTRAVMTWQASPDALVQLYQPEWRVDDGNSPWRVLPRVAGFTATIDDMAEGLYQFRVAAVNSNGALSAYISTTKTINGQQDPPQTPTGLTLQPVGAIALLNWNETPDLDVRIGGHILFRHSTATTGATWDAASTLGPQGISGGTTTVALPLKVGTYLAKFRDASGKFSTDAASVVNTQAPAGFSNVTTITEDPTFLGSKTNCGVSAGTLNLNAGATSAIYNFAGSYDAGSVQSLRFTSAMAAFTYQITGTVGTRAGLVSSWTSFAGGISGQEAEAWVEVRSTNDNPVGAPLWTPWVRLDAASITGRAFQFRVQMTAVNANYSVQVSELSVVIDQVA